MVVGQIQQQLKEARLDGWLFFDHHRRDPLAYRILRLPDTIQPTRRWFYFIPAQGDPLKLVHRIESGVLDTVEGSILTYASWADQQQKLQKLLHGVTRIAMQYSPQCAIPYISLVDAGTIELVRGFGIEVVSSADVVQIFEARWTDEQYQLHLTAGKLVDQVRREAFDFAGERRRSNENVTEHLVQQFILSRFRELNLTADHGPIVAVNANASNPHYEPTVERTSPIRAGDLLLIDLWAKLLRPNAVFYDITWTGFCGEVIPDKIQNIFEIVREARQQACGFIRRKIAAGEEICGYQIDDVARGHIQAHNLGEYFFHRTGHSIGTDIHGTGANIDNLESHDTRKIIANTGFSIEPGIYLPEFGIRSEVNVFVGQGFADVTGEEQNQIVRI